VMAKRKRIPQFAANDRVTASYRVVPFLTDDVLVVVQQEGNRVFCVAESRDVGGWLDAETLEEVL
jgi:hypothetical protein